MPEVLLACMGRRISTKLWLGGVWLYDVHGGTHKHTHTYTHAYPYTHKRTQSHTNKHTNAQTNTHTPANADAHTYAHAYAHNACERERTRTCSGWIDRNYWYLFLRNIIFISVKVFPLISPLISLSRSCIVFLPLSPAPRHGQWGGGSGGCFALEPGCAGGAGEGKM